MTLNRENWIDAGWSLLAAKGVQAVKVEVLARKLKVSKGSFYWHFKNRQELLEAILQRWEDETMKVIQRSPTLADTPKERLFKLFALIEELCEKPDPETAIFQWANQDEAVQQRVHALETKRVKYLSQLFQDCGFDETEARHRAEVAYFALMGFADRRERDSKFELKMGEFNNFLLSLLLSPRTTL